MIKFNRTDRNYGCFSNFFKCSVMFNGLEYKSSEAAWQAQKTLNAEERVSFTTLEAGASKRKGRSVNLRTDWELVKYKLMVEVCYAKFSQHPELAEVLLSTGDEEIVENTTAWHDNIWGNCECPKCVNKVGKNLLGKALMEVREQLKKGSNK